MIAEKIALPVRTTGFRYLKGDGFGRSFKKLRLSVLSVCNFNCVYCDPQGEKRNSGTIGRIKSLSPGGLAETVKRIHDRVGLTSVRITGGEPLLYRRLPELIRLLKQIGIPSVSLTTNASKLSERLSELLHSGLDGINISLDAIDQNTFQKMSGGHGNLEDVMDGIDGCRSSGISLKINSTIVKGINDIQTLDLLDFAMARNITLRYIELMEMGPLFGNIKEKLFSQSEILDAIGKKYSYEKLPRNKSSTAHYYRIAETGYQFGIISNVSEPFCNDCDRLRLSSDGKIFGCLSENRGFSVTGVKEEDVFDEILHEALLQKKKNGFMGSSLSMKDIGG